jgi:hypothetical protein
MVVDGVIHFTMNKWIYVLILELFLGISAFYILCFKVPEKRRQSVAIPFTVAGIFFTAFLPFPWNCVIALTVMWLVVLIGWLYPSQRTDRDQV